MKITFKDVGQGDSIILEWQAKGCHKIGIIDCNLKGNRNPVLEYFIKKEYKEVDFIILSHPHRDHYSGFSTLLDYFETNKIAIKRFGHTLSYIGPGYYKYCEIGSDDKKLLRSIFEKLERLKQQGLILKSTNLSEDMVIELSDDIKMFCLAPSEAEAKLYQQTVRFNADKNDKEASQAANFLATAFLLNFRSLYCLLTSDVEAYALQGILKRNADKFKGAKFHLCQIPHHGSEKNHYPDFWDIVETNGNKHAIASAGKHRTYNHPSFYVLRAFHNKGYVIHCTNFLNGMKEYTKFLSMITRRSLELEAVSTIAEEYRKSNDRVFELKAGTPS